MEIVRQDATIEEGFLASRTALGVTVYFFCAPLETQGAVSEDMLAGLKPGAYMAQDNPRAGLKTGHCKT